MWRAAHVYFMHDCALGQVKSHIPRDERRQRIRAINRYYDELLEALRSQMRLHPDQFPDPDSVLGPEARSILSRFMRYLHDQNLKIYDLNDYVPHKPGTS